MITSIFLMFVAAGIAFASVVYGFGGVFPLIVAVTVLTVLFRTVGIAMSSRVPEPFTA